MKKKYHNREIIVHRLSQPGSPSINVISEETGVPKATLYAWLANQKRLSRSTNFSTGQLAMTKRTKPRSPSVKFALIAESFSLQGEALKIFCHQKGVTVEELLSWRDLALSGIELADGNSPRMARKEHNEEVTFLKADLRRKNDALAETAALLVLQKKLWRSWEEKSDT